MQLTFFSFLFLSLFSLQNISMLWMPINYSSNSTLSLHKLGAEGEVCIQYPLRACVFHQLLKKEKHYMVIMSCMFGSSNRWSTLLIILQLLFFLSYYYFTYHLSWCRWHTITNIFRVVVSQRKVLCDRFIYPLFISWCHIPRMQWVEC